MNKKRYIESLDRLKAIPETDSERLIRAAGIISTYVKEAYGIELIVVGGLSVEVYTKGGYTTQDIDFVGVHHEKIMQGLVELGFKRKGKDSVHDELRIFVEVPGSVLKDADEAYITTVTTKDGYQLRVIGREDIIKDRLTALVQWDDKIQAIWAYQLIKNHIDDLDIAYIRKTVGEKERAIFDGYVKMLQENDVLLQRQTETIHFLQQKGIPFVVLDGIIALATGTTYYGFTLTPIVMGYTYEEEDDEDILEMVRDREMTIEELCDWLKEVAGDDVKKVDDLIHHLNQIK